MSLYPEMCRVYTFGRLGSSQGQFFDQHLAPIQLCENAVDWKQQDISYASNQHAYEQWLYKEMERAKIAQHWNTNGHQATKNETRLLWYESDEQDSALAHYGLMTDSKWGRARASYKGILVFRHNGQRVFLAPKTSVLELDIQIITS